MSLEIPLLFWNDAPEGYDITCSYLTKTRLVVGTEQSFLVLYYIKRTKTCQPFAILKGHDSPLSALTECNVHSADCVISVCKSGTLCAWHLIDGRCMLILPQICHPDPLDMVALPQFSRVAVCGKSNSIEVIDLLQPSIIYKLRGHCDFIRCLSCGILQEFGVLISGSTDNTLRYWMLRTLKKRQQKRETTKLISTTSVKVSTSKDKNSPDDDPSRDEVLSVSNTRDWTYVLVVFPKKWELYSFGATEPMIAMPEVSLKENYSGGFFLNKTMLFVHTDHGNGLLYRLPERKVNDQDLLHLGFSQFSRPYDDMDSDSQSSDTEEDEEEEEGEEVEGKPESTGDEKPKKKKKKMTFGDRMEEIKELDKLHRKLSKERTRHLKKAKSYFSPKIRRHPHTEHAKLVTLPSGNRAQNDENVDDHEKKTPSMYDLKKLNEKLSMSSPSSQKKMKAAPRPSSPLTAPPAVIARFDYEKKNRKNLSDFPTRFIWKHVEDDMLMRVACFSGEFHLRGYSEVKIWKIHLPAVTEHSVGIKEIPVRDVDENWTRTSHQKKRRKKIRETKRVIRSLSKGRDIKKNKDGVLPTSNIMDHDITSSDFFLDEELGTFLVYGFRNGSVEIIPGFGESLEIPNAHDEAITSVLLMKDDFLDRIVLITGSNDTLVRAWNVKKLMKIAEKIAKMENVEEKPKPYVDQVKERKPTKKKRAGLMKTFHFHNQRVTDVFLPSSYFREKLSNGFCSLGEDHSIVLYSLKFLECVHVFGGHSAPILDVFWRADLDYLLVRCADNIIFVWHISTGLLERRVSGILSKDLLERSEGGRSFRKPINKDSFFRGGMMMKKASSSNEDYFQRKYRKDSRRAKHKYFFKPILLPRLNVLGVGLRVRSLIGYILEKKEMYKSIVKNENQNLLKQTKEGKKTRTNPTGEPHYFQHFVDHMPAALRSGLANLFRSGDCHTLSLLRKLLKIDGPLLQPHVGMKGASVFMDMLGSKGMSKREVFTLYLPKQKFHEFRFSSILSASLVVSTISVLNSLAYFPEIRQLCVETKQYYLDELSHSFSGQFEQPSYLWCAQFLKDSTKEIQLATRSVMGATLNKMGLAETKEMSRQLASLVVRNNPSLLKNRKARNQLEEENSEKEDVKASSKEKQKKIEEEKEHDAKMSERNILEKNVLDVNKIQNVIVSLAVLGSRVPKAMDTSVAVITCNGLVEIMKGGGSQHMTAISLLGEGYRIWQHYVESPEFILRELFTFSLPALTKRDTKIDPDSLSVDSYKAFLNIAVIDTKMYIDFLGGIAKNSNTPMLTLCACVKTMSPLIDLYPDVLVGHLVVVISLLLKLLGPSRIPLREATTFILRKMVAKYPMISFHQSKQKLAVGNSDGIIVIYDMQTTTKWQLFEAHNGPVRAIQFNPNGKWLASYSPNDYLCKIWNVDSGGMLNLLGMTTRSIKNFRVVFSDPKQPLSQIMKHVYIKWNLKDRKGKKFILCPGRDLQKIVFSV